MLYFSALSLTNTTRIIQVLPIAKINASESARPLPIGNEGLVGLFIRASPLTQKDKTMVIVLSYRVKTFALFIPFNILRNMKCHGFTLVELLVTIVIIGILATITTSTISTYIDKARISATLAHFEVIENSLITAMTINGLSSYPLESVPDTDGDGETSV